jgi:hypothetical protein
MVFASPFGQFYLDVISPYRLSELSHLDNFIMIRKSCPLTETLPAFVKTSAFKAKTHANPDTDGNSPYHRAVMRNISLNLILIPYD